MLKVKTDKSSNQSSVTDEKPKAYNRNNLALGRKRSRTRQTYADT